MLLLYVPPDPCYKPGPHAAMLHTCNKPGPHAAMLHTCDGVFQTTCDGSKSHAMCCDRKINMLNILLLILEYLSYLLFDFQTGFSNLMGV